MYRLPDTNQPLDFPDDFETSPEGLLAIGGNLHPQTLIQAYKKGIFPWFSEGDPILWWHPDPRMVLFPQELHVSQSMQKVRKQFESSSENRFLINSDFLQVMLACAEVARKNQDGTWITESMVQAYFELHKKGFAHSYEIWQGEELVGGLYGVKIGKVFFGESMFHKSNNMSKLALIYLCEHLLKEGCLMLDCQQETQHLASMGARPIPRIQFLEILAKNQD